MKLCECGCGQPAPIAKMTRRSQGHHKGEPIRFIRGHNPKNFGRTFSHGHCRGKQSPEYMAWRDMKQRCLNPKNRRYADYGGRGITICQSWMDFENFLEDMGERPAWADGGLDRIDNDGNYELGNCRWATKKEQMNNKRQANQYVKAA